MTIDEIMSNPQKWNSVTSSKISRHLFSLFYNLDNAIVDSQEEETPEG